MKNIALIAAFAAAAAAIPVDEPAATATPTIHNGPPPSLPFKAPEPVPYYQAVKNPDGTIRIEGTATTVNFEELSKGYTGNITQLRSAVDAYLATKAPAKSKGLSPAMAIPNAGGCWVESYEWLWGPFDYYYWDDFCQDCQQTTITKSESKCYGVSISFGGDWTRTAFGLGGSIEGSYQHCTEWGNQCELSERKDKLFVCMYYRVGMIQKKGTAKFWLACGDDDIPQGEEPQSAGPEGAVKRRGISYREHTEYVEARVPMGRSYHHCEGYDDPPCWRQEW
ncbi:hypothetical protein HDU96_009231 [Phlyctochytrium bullatum]|nr:hypothetical protein HDU96_009231 [Phlyctochytrium bullatum]